MAGPRKIIRDRMMRYAGRLRYPRLLGITLVLFILDLLIPDLVPFADEILLGLISLLLAGLKKRDGEPPGQEGTPGSKSR